MAARRMGGQSRSSRDLTGDERLAEVPRPGLQLAPHRTQLTRAEQTGNRSAAYVQDFRACVPSWPTLCVQQARPQRDAVKRWRVDSHHHGRVAPMIIITGCARTVVGKCRLLQRLTGQTQAAGQVLEGVALQNPPALDLGTVITAPPIPTVVPVRLRTNRTAQAGLLVEHHE